MGSGRAHTLTFSVERIAIAGSNRDITSSKLNCLNIQIRRRIEHYSWCEHTNTFRTILHRIAQMVAPEQFAYKAMVIRKTIWISSFEHFQLIREKESIQTHCILNNSLCIVWNLIDRHICMAFEKQIKLPYALWCDTRLEIRCILYVTPIAIAYTLERALVTWNKNWIRIELEMIDSLSIQSKLNLPSQNVLFTGHRTAYIVCHPKIWKI